MRNEMEKIKEYAGLLASRLKEGWKIYTIAALVIWVVISWMAGVMIKLLRNMRGEPHGLPATVYGLLAVWPLAISMLVVIGYNVYVIMKRPRNMDSQYNVEYSDSDVAGSAAFIRSPEKEQKFEITSIENTDEVIFGYDMDFYGRQSHDVIAVKKDDDDLYLNGHKIVIGGSGSRKTTTQILPDALQAVRRGESIIALDPKGELYGLLKILLEGRGYDIKAFNLKSPSNSDGIDFLNELRSSSYNQSEVLTNLEILAESIILNTDGANPGSTFWRDGAKACLKGAIAYELTMGNDTTFKDVYHDIQLDIKDFVGLFDGLTDDSPARNYVKMVLDKYNSGNVKDAESALGGLKSRLTIFADPTLRELVSNRDMSLKEPGRRPTAYFIITPDQHSTMNFMKNMFFSLIFIKLTDLADSQKGVQALPVKVNMLLDEFPSIGKLDDFQGKLNTLRSRNIAITVVCQDLGQLMRNYPDHEWESIVEACDICTYLGGNDITSTADYLCKRLGITTAVDRSDRYESNRYMRGMDHLRPSVASSERNVGRNLRETYEIVLKDINLAISCVKGCRPLEYYKFDYRDHPLAAEMVTSSFTEHIPSWRRQAFGIPLGLDDRELSGCIDDYILHKAADPGLTFERYRDLEKEGKLKPLDADSCNPLSVYLRDGEAVRPSGRQAAAGGDIITDEAPEEKKTVMAGGAGKPKSYMQILKEKKEAEAVSGTDAAKKSRALIDSF